jgi:transposase
MTASGEPVLFAGQLTFMLATGLRRRDPGFATEPLGVAIKEIVRLTGKSRGMLRQLVRDGRTDVFRSRTCSLEPFLKQLDADWLTGCHNGAALWRRVKVTGFAGAARVVAEWATRRRKEEATATGDGRPRKVPSARGVARMMTVERDVLSKAATRTMAIIAGAVPALVVACDLMDRFHRMIQHRTSADLESWIIDATSGLLGSFTKGIVQDRAGVHAAMTQPWSNGQTEGQNTKLKLVKRQMYGRAKLDLLQARLLRAA